MLVGHGEARAALFRLETVSYPFLAAADKREWLRRLARFAFAVEADFSLWRVCRAYPAERYAEQAEALLDARHQSPAAWRSYLRGHEAHLRELRSFVPEVYLAVSLAAERPGGPLRGMDRVRRRVEELFGVAATPPIAASELEALIVAEERAFRRAAGCLPVRRATTRELQWLLRRAACRGRRRAGAGRSLGAERADRRDAPTAAWRMSRWGRTWCGTPTRRSSRRTATLVIDAPGGPQLPGAAGHGRAAGGVRVPRRRRSCCSAPLEALPFPVDAVLHARWLGNRDAVTRVRRRIVDADVAFSEQLTSAHGPLSYAAEENRQLARELDAYLQSHERPPLFSTRDLAGGRRRLARGARAPRRGAPSPLRHGRAAPAARAAAGAVRWTISRARTAARCATTPTC